MNKVKKLFAVLIFPVTLFAQNKTADQLREFLQGQQHYFGFNGNVLYAEKGKPVYTASMGYADFAYKRLLNDSSVFELASLSKQFTAMGIIICKEKMGLRYDDPVKKYLNDFPYDRVTIRHLLTHTSGLPEYEAQLDKTWDHSKIATNIDVLNTLVKLKDTLLFKPGSKWQYSNTGYAILAAIIEKVSKQSYGDFLAANIFQPLNMTHTFVYNTRRSTKIIPANYALGFVWSPALNKYVLPDDDKKYDYVYYLDGIVGDGTVNSTTGDLLKWENHLMANKNLPEIKEMLSPLVRISPTDSTGYYGFGEMVQVSSSNGKTIWHTGGWPGYTTYMSYREKPDQTIIILSNNEKANGQLRAAVEAILDGESLIMPYEHTEVKIDPALLDKYAGKYSAFLTLEFIAKDGKLWRHRNGTPDIELKPESNTKFFYADGTDRQIEFIVEPDGSVKKGWFINTGQKGELTRLK